MSEDKSFDSEQRETDLSGDELEAVSGGADRDWTKDGCAATVEPGSWCRSNDKCSWFSVTYDNAPENEKCSKCGSYMYIYKSTTVRAGGESRVFDYYRCPKCGNEKNPK